MFERAIFARASVVSVLDVGCVKGFSFLNKFINVLSSRLFLLTFLGGDCGTDRPITLGVTVSDSIATGKLAKAGSGEIILLNLCMADPEIDI